MTAARTGPAAATPTTVVDLEDADSTHGSARATRMQRARPAGATRARRVQTRKQKSWYRSSEDLNKVVGLSTREALAPREVNQHISSTISGKPLLVRGPPYPSNVLIYPVKRETDHFLLRMLLVPTISRREAPLRFA